MNDESSAAYHLVGLTLHDGWEVLNRVERADGLSAGAFSVSYLARSLSGEMGFMKAFDYAKALTAEDPARELEYLASSYNAERDLLAVCGGRRLARVVRALAAGTIQVPSYAPGAVSYLIFELADGDARDALAELDPADQVPMLALVHDAAVAMSQLHSIRVAHQDVKPANLLTFGAGASLRGKLADLGSAHVEGKAGPHDHLAIPGDCEFSAPELLYGGHDRLPDEQRRFAADLYMLGNLLCFLLARVTYSAVLFGHLDETQHWKRYGGRFDEVLAGLMDAHGLALSRIGEALGDPIAADVIGLLNDLCCPDPQFRGDPVARGWGQNPYGLERFVSRLDRVHRKARIAARASA